MVAVVHRETVPETVQALEEHPAVGGIRFVGLAEPGDHFLVRFAHRDEVGLDDAVVAPRLEELRALSEDIGEGLSGRVGVDADRVGEDMGLSPDRPVRGGQRLEHLQRRACPGRGEFVQEPGFIASLLLLPRQLAARLERGHRFGRCPGRHGRPPARRRRDPDRHDKAEAPNATAPLDSHGLDGPRS